MLWQYATQIVHQISVHGKRYLRHRGWCINKQICRLTSRWSTRSWFLPTQCMFLSSSVGGSGGRYGGATISSLTRSSIMCSRRTYSASSSKPAPVQKSKTNVNTCHISRDRKNEARTAVNRRPTGVNLHLYHAPQWGGGANISLLSYLQNYWADFQNSNGVW